MDFREEIADALAAVAGAFPGASLGMRLGDGPFAPAVRCSSSESGDAVTEDAPAEEFRLACSAADFPGIGAGDPAELSDGTLRAVTSVRRDPAGASLSVGVSRPFEPQAAAYSGTRRAGASARTLRLPVNALFLETGVSDAAPGAPSPSYAATFLAAIRREDWRDESGPAPSDTLDLARGGRRLRLKVSSAARKPGWYILKCREK